MAMRFTMAQHETRGVQIVEVWVNDQFVGAIYPGERDDEIKIVSKHLKTALFDESYPPSLTVMLTGAGS